MGAGVGESVEILEGKEWGCVGGCMSECAGALGLWGGEDQDWKRGLSLDAPTCFWNVTYYYWEKKCKTDDCGCSFYAFFVYIYLSIMHSLCKTQTQLLISEVDVKFFFI